MEPVAAVRRTVYGNSLTKINTNNTILTRICWFKPTAILLLTMACCKVVIVLNKAH